MILCKWNSLLNLRLKQPGIASRCLKHRSLMRTRPFQMHRFYSSLIQSQWPSLKISNTKSIVKESLMPMEQYAKARKVDFYPIRRDIKKRRLLQIGPFITATFENYDLMWMQVHEMLYIEKGGEEQIQDELKAYNPLIPQGSDFPFTLMIEVDNVERRTKILQGLCDIESQITLRYQNEAISPTQVDENIMSIKDGKTSAVHFLRFVLKDLQKQKFANLTETDTVIFQIDHANYRHSAGLSWELIQDLQRDLDL